MRSVVMTVLLCAAAVQAAAAQDWDPDRNWRHRDGVHIRVGRDYHLPADRVAETPVIVVGGTATIDGRVEDDLLVVGGAVRIGPTAQVRANVVALGGSVDVADGAQVTGEIQDVAVMWPELRFALREWMWQVDRGWWAGLVLALTVIRFVFVMLGASLLALIAPGWIRRIGERLADAPIVSGLVGLCGEIMCVPVFLAVVAALIVTVIGIPLLILVPFAVLAFCVVWLAGFAAVAAYVGAGARWRTGLGTDSPAIDAAWGVMLLFVCTFLGNVLAFGPPVVWPLAAALGAIGFVIELVAWAAGLGAALLAPFRQRWPVAPPPMPSAAPAAPPPSGFGTANA